MKLRMFTNLRARNKNRNSFTLIELLVVLALVAILSVVVVMTLNPAELLKQARDSNRLSDLATINTALNLFSTDVISGFMGTSTIVYVSLPSTTSNCSNLGLPTLPSGYTYNCVTQQNLRNTDGTGWIPVNFQRISSNSPISQLPIDPTNTTSSGNYYTYVSGGSWILTAIPESTKQKTELSNNPHLSKYPGVIGMGNNLDLSPLYNSSGLVGYWKFDEGSGTTAKDSSGQGNNGTIAGTPVWQVGKNNLALDFNSGSSFVVVPDADSLDIPNTLTISAWIKYMNTPATSEQNFPIQKWTSTANANYVWYWYSSGYVIPNANIIIATVGGVWSGMTDYQTILPNSIWHHVVFTYDATPGSAKVYIDGIMTGSQSVGPGVLSTNGAEIAIGQLVSGYRAHMDEIRIYNRVLSAAEVLALYNATR